MRSGAVVALPCQRAYALSNCYGRWGRGLKNYPNIVNPVVTEKSPRHMVLEGEGEEFKLMFLPDGRKRAPERRNH